MSVLVILEGGMGSQMFGYAHGRTLSLKNKTDLILDHTYTKVGQRIPREYSLGFWNIAGSLIHHDMRVTNPLIVSGNAWMGLDCFAGYGQTLRQDFTPTKEAEEIMKSKVGYHLFQEVEHCNSVSIGVRRGDFADEPVSRVAHGTIPLEYYYEAIKQIAERVRNPIFYIFSDGIEWVKQNLQPDYPHFYVSGNDLTFQEEFWLNSKCKHHIISNSTFFWWSAWLGNYPDKVTYAPKYWHHKYKPRPDFFPIGWTLL